MDTASENRLSLVNPTLATKVRAASASMEAVGTFLLVVSGLRTASEQNTLYAQGRTAPGHIVTNAKAGFSMHNYGLAVDIVPFLSGDSGALNWKPETPQFKAMVGALQSQGLIWGGDWKKIKDNDHFQLGGLPPTPSQEMIADYARGLEYIWSNIGKYGGSV